MVTSQKFVLTYVVFRKLQGITLFVLHREDSNKQFALSEALKHAAEIRKTIGSALNMV
jgi:hypothetical protein